jgi:hypothetical protein
VLNIRMMEMIMVHLFSNKKISLVIRFCGMKLKLNYVSSNSPLWLDSTMWVRAKYKNMVFDKANE